MSVTSFVRLKCRYEAEIRTVVVNIDTVDYSELTRRLSKDWGFDVSLKYEDCDGDANLLSSQNDFEGMIHGQANETINVFVSRCKPLPSVHAVGTLSREGSLTSLSTSGTYSSATVSRLMQIWWKSYTTRSQRSIRR